MTQKFENVRNYLQEEADWYEKNICGDGSKTDKEYKELRAEFLEAIKILEKEGEK
jgi:hypothetical protein